MSAPAATAKPTPKKRRKTPKKTYLGRIYIGRDEDGKQLFEYVGRFDRKKDRDSAVEKAKEARRNGDGSGTIEPGRV